MSFYFIPELLNEVNDYIEPTLELRCVSRKYYKLYTPEIREKYPLHFHAIDYLNALRICPTYNALSIYFPYNYWLSYDPQKDEMIYHTNKLQCKGYTKKGLRCKRYSCDAFCYNHRNTLKTYQNSKMFHYLTDGIF
ncbi:MAG: hypothetical protein CMF80_07100 [Candidatus Marinimicrobia bacterium]|nr:hypothetical protein [Candidatus Neomarinimicrobiota bacterium]